MKIASWNVNSIKVRLPQVLSWLEANEVDILALQETKVTDELFPFAAFEEIGYQVCFSGQKTYNGVAILSKSPLTAVTNANPFFNDDAKRVLAATTKDIRIINLYVPNGQSLDSEKYTYKLAWLEGMKQFLQAELKAHEKLVVLGDFNIAPTPIDVHDPAQWDGGVLVSEKEREAFFDFLDLGLVDLVRHYDSKPGIFTWWDYRQAAFRRNLGLRIDHILVSQALLADTKAYYIDLEARKAQRPSDHAPIWALL